MGSSMFRLRTPGSLVCRDRVAVDSVPFDLFATTVLLQGYLTCDLLRYMDLLDIMISVLFITFGGILVPGGRVHLDVSLRPADALC